MYMIKAVDLDTGVSEVVPKTEVATHVEAVVMIERLREDRRKKRKENGSYPMPVCGIVFKEDN